MAGMADEQDVVVVLDQPLRLTVNLGDERAGGVDVGEVAALGCGGHRFGDAMRRKYYGPVIGHLVEFVDENRTELAQAVDDVAVVDDFVPHIDGRSEPLERKLDDLDRAIDAGAETTRRGDQDAQGRE